MTKSSLALLLLLVRLVMPLVPDARVSDVLIVGAGPAGCAAGIELQRAGFSVCVVDSAVFPRDKVCGDAISNEGMRELDELGAGHLVRASDHALVRLGAALLPDGTRIVRRYDPPGFIVPRFDLDDCLRRSLEAHGARLVQNTRVQALVREGGRFCGLITAQERLSAKLVLACDGYGSVAWRALDVEAPRASALGVSTTAYYRNVSSSEYDETAEHYFEEQLPYGYGWIFPPVGGVSNVGVYLRSDAYLGTGQRLAELLDGFIARRGDRLAGAQRVGGLRSWPLPLATRDLPLTASGLILAGDAAGLIDPLSGEGIWQALYSGRLAGQIAARALREGELSAELAAEYAAACKRRILGPSRQKSRAQAAMNVLVTRGLYRLPLMKSALRWGYANKRLEMTKI